MAVAFKVSEECLTACLSGEIDHHTARDLREQIDRVLTLNQPALLVLDFSEVGFMDSSGVGLVMGRYRRVAQMGGALHITGAGGSIAKMLTLGGIERLATIEKR